MNELKRMQQLAGILKESTGLGSSMSWLKRLTPEIEKSIDRLKQNYPDYTIKITDNSTWRRDRPDLKGTYTLSVDGPVITPELKVDIGRIVDMSRLQEGFQGDNDDQDDGMSGFRGGALDRSTPNEPSIDKSKLGWQSYRLLDRYITKMTQEQRFRLYQTIAQFLTKQGIKNPDED